MQPFHSSIEQMGVLHCIMKQEDWEDSEMNGRWPLNSLFRKMMCARCSAAGGVEKRGEKRVRARKGTGVFFAMGVSIKDPRPLLSSRRKESAELASFHWVFVNGPSLVIGNWSLVIFLSVYRHRRFRDHRYVAW